MKIPDIEHSVYIDTPIQKVYETLTTAEGWDSWFTKGTEIEAKKDGFIRLRWNNFGASHYTTSDGGKVLEVIPNEKFVFEWSPGTAPTTVSFTLKEQGSGTIVSLTETGYQESNRNLKTCIDCAVGWGEALILLKFYLEHGVTYGEVPEK